ncbi:hypothetical protein J2X76_005514 [Neorhizobium sp. 2083]|nr:hypothetical protein [Neorhizobium sp. 2083]
MLALGGSCIRAMHSTHRSRSSTARGLPAKSHLYVSQRFLWAAKQHLRLAYLPQGKKPRRGTPIRFINRSPRCKQFILNRYYCGHDGCCPAKSAHSSFSEIRPAIACLGSLDGILDIVLLPPLSCATPFLLDQSACSDIDGYSPSNSLTQRNTTPCLPYKTERQSMRQCKQCDDTGWVCERHLNKPWSGKRGCGCGGAGLPCQNCTDDDGWDQPPNYTQLFRSMTPIVGKKYK